MKREDAEKLLTALIFDDLDDDSRAELEAYLETDDELRQQMVDLRMTLKVTRDAIHQEPEPVLSAERLAQLETLAQEQSSPKRLWVLHHYRSIAAILVLVMSLGGIFLFSLDSTQSLRLTLMPEQQKVASPLIAETSKEELAGGTSSIYDKKGTSKYDVQFSDSTSSEISLRDRESLGRETVLHSIQEQDGKNPTQLALSEEAFGEYAARGVVSEQITLGTEVDGDSLDFQGVYNAGRDYSMNGDLIVMDQLQPLDAIKELREAQAGNTNLLINAQATDPAVTLEWQRLPSDAVESTDFFVSNGSPAYGYGNGGNSGPINQPALSMQPVQDGYWLDSSGKQRPDEDVTERLESKVLGRDGDIVVSNRTTSEVDDLSESSRADSNKKVPVLGDVPVAGALFRSTGDPNQVGKYEHGLTDVIDDSALPPASRFKTVPLNPWVLTKQDALSTFALDVDTASYTLCRRYIQGGFLPPAGAVRMEEFVNAFDYHYPQRNDTAFAVYAEAAPAPFAPAGQPLTLLKVAVKARTLGRDQRKAAHLVWVVDTSASMGQDDRLPLIQRALHHLTDRLDPRDRVSLVTCDRQARLILERVSSQQGREIHAAIDAIQPSGSTHLVAGLKLGYATARQGFGAGQVNHVLLCSDGIANVGQTEADDILREVADERVQGITMTCIGAGYGAYNDALLEALADRGDGSYAYLDGTPASQQALVQSLCASMQGVARDARIQVAFNPERVHRYRLIGYENRDIADERFRDDTVDAGEVGSGQCSTALYELELVGSALAQPQLGEVTVRYLDVETSQMAEVGQSLTQALVQRRTVEDSPGFYLAAVSARFAEWLRHSEYAQDTDYQALKRTIDQVQGVLSLDPKVADLQQLIHQAEGLPQAP